MAYKMDLPATSQVHPVFHVSQLKPFVPSYIPAFDKVSKIPDLVRGEVIPLEIVDMRLVKKGNAAVTQILVKWSVFLSIVLLGRTTMCSSNNSQLLPFG